MSSSWHFGDHDSFQLLSDQGTERHEDEIDGVDSIEGFVFPRRKALTHREFSQTLLAAVYLLALDYCNYSTESSSVPRRDVRAGGPGFQDCWLFLTSSEAINGTGWVTSSPKTEESRLLGHDS